MRETILVPWWGYGFDDRGFVNGGEGNFDFVICYVLLVEVECNRSYPWVSVYVLFPKSDALYSCQANPSPPTHSLYSILSHLPR